MRSARPVGSGFFPLDDELGLLPGCMSPTVAEGAIRLATDLSFERAAQTLTFFWRVRVSASTLRRQTEAAGAAVVAEQTAAVERLERTLSEPPPGPARLQLSLDGAMVPLVGGLWAEVKTAALGVLPETIAADADGPHATELSYFSRLTDAATFTRLLAGELERRGLERAGTVVAVMDGAEWQQRTVDRYRPDAVRILDFPHAVEHLSAAAHAVWGTESADAAAWSERIAHTLKHGEPDAVLDALRALPVRTARDAAAAERAQGGTLGYLEKRREQIRYAAFRAQGYPIGSGLVESANKLVVEARLKGSGMHWDPDNVNPMLALRTVACAGRWDETVPLIRTRLRAAAAARQTAWWQARHPAPEVPVPPEAPAGDADAPAETASPPEDTSAPAVVRADHPRTMVDGRPTAHHPWRAPLHPPRQDSGKL